MYAEVYAFIYHEDANNNINEHLESDIWLLK